MAESPWLRWSEADWRKFLVKMPELMEELLAHFGQPFADYDDKGNLVGGGTECKLSGRKYVYVLATNDAADHLSAWMDEQLAMRKAAAENAGQSVYAKKSVGSKDQLAADIAQSFDQYDSDSD